MPRASKHSSNKIADRTIVVDNGAFSIKAGFVSDEPIPETECHIIPNCMAKTRDKTVIIGSQLDKCKDFGGMTFRRPVEKGYVVAWDVELEIWNNTFFDKNAKLKCDPHETNLILTEAPNAPMVLQTNTEQMIFEEFEFASCYKCIGTTLNAYNDFSLPPSQSFPPLEPLKQPRETLLLIDSGYSHTVVTPLLYGQPIHQAVRRLDVGGKILTNYLKELVSLRHYNMMDEDHLINNIKEAVCFVSQDFKADLERTWKGGIADPRRPKPNADQNSIVVDFVLPDYNKLKAGYMRPHDPSKSLRQRKASLGADGETLEDFMTLGNERFAVPELLFNPSDVGIKQAGIPEVILQSLSTLPSGLWGAMLANVIVVGGNSRIDGFIERLEKELRLITPSEYVIRVTKAAEYDHSS
ncbi:MAG: Actin- protein 6 [Trizodia sp. TS-e1964]|nr:MAG: Actin- protein 6 [Trizodia sp. TS-e1964]